MILFLLISLTQVLDLIDLGDIRILLNKKESIQFNGFSGMATIFDSLKNLEIAIKPDDHEELGPFSSDNNVKGCYFPKKNYSITVTAKKDQSVVRVYSVFLSPNCTEICILFKNTSTNTVQKCQCILDFDSSFPVDETTNRRNRNYIYYYETNKTFERNFWSIFKKINPTERNTPKIKDPTPTPTPRPTRTRRVFMDPMTILLSDDTSGSNNSDFEREGMEHYHIFDTCLLYNYAYYSLVILIPFFLGLFFWFCGCIYYCHTYNCCAHICSKICL